MDSIRSGSDGRKHLQRNEKFGSRKRTQIFYKCRWEENIRMDLEEIGINAGKCVDSAQDRNYWRTLVNAALNFRVHKPWSQCVVGRNDRNV